MSSHENGLSRKGGAARRCGEKVSGRPNARYLSTAHSCVVSTVPSARPVLVMPLGRVNQLTVQMAGKGNQGAGNSIRPHLQSSKAVLRKLWHGSSPGLPGRLITGKWYLRCLRSNKHKIAATHHHRCSRYVHVLRSTVYNREKLDCTNDVYTPLQCSRDNIDSGRVDRDDSRTSAGIGGTI